VIVGESLAEAKEEEWHGLGRGIFLRKNLPKDWMRKKIAEWLKKPPSGENEDSGLHAILLADDDSELLNSLEKTLSERHFRVLTALDGNQALKRALKAKPDLILLDVDMPGLTGIQVLAHLRKVEETKAIPVIMMTADSAHATVNQALELGISDYMVKPFNQDALVRRIRNILAEDRRAT
jgi:CheY-like chemotaxis protein